MIRRQSGGSGSPGKPHWMLLEKTTIYKKGKKVGKIEQKNKAHWLILQNTKHKIQKKKWKK